jgi:hypothetical protein
MGLMHREVAELRGTYTLREQSKVYGVNFGSESEVLNAEQFYPMGEKR